MASYKPTYIAATKPTDTVGEYTPGTYQSQYGTQLSNALNKVTNWTYNPLEDASYQALAKIYASRGNQAAKSTMADAASLNGGYGTSYATTAAQQTRNQYNQELASYIPDLEANAYSKATGTLSALRDADDTDYSRFRDTESDNQWSYSQNYQKYRDAMSDYQNALDYNATVYSLKKSSSGGSSSGSSGGYTSSGSNSLASKYYSVAEANQRSSSASDPNRAAHDQITTKITYKKNK